MDKRTLIFVVCLTATFFVVNLFFSFRKDDQAREWQQEQELVQAKKQSQLEISVAARTAPMEALPLVDIFADADGRERLTTGVWQEGSVLTLGWKEELPTEVYVKGEALKLAAQDGVGQPVIYGKKMEIGVVPRASREDLQLVIPGTNTVTLAEVEGGMVTPLLTSPQENAIVLRQQGATYFPIGVYEANSKRFVQLSDEKELADFVAEVIPTVTAQEGDQKYYVLENAYQQLVFSNYGGALAEINLPFESETDHASVVQEIGFGRTMVADYPTNAYFPDFAYYVPGPNGRPVEKMGRELGGYYPLLRRDVIGENGQTTVAVPPKFYALNVVSKYPEVANLVYEVKEFTDKKIVFEAVQNHRTIRKVFELGEAPYAIDLTVEVNGDRALTGDLFLTSGVPEVEWMSGRAAPALKMRSLRGNKGETEKISFPKPDQMISVTSSHPEWVSNGNGFFGVILDPLSEVGGGYRAQFVSGLEVPSRLVVIDREHDRFKASKLPGYNLLIPLKSGGGAMKFRVYAGPYDNNVLKLVDAFYTDPTTGANPDYVSARSFHGYLIFVAKPFAKFLYVIISFFHWLTDSWAISIILLTVVLRLILYPLSSWSMKSMKRMQIIQPEVKRIQAKYKKDPRRSQSEIMQLYRKRKVNPFSGCLPLIIQMPFLIGMFDLLKSTFALRGAGFIPGWINDLTAPDVLFSWSTPVFFLGTEFHLLPILLGGVMFIQQRFTSKLPKDKSTWTDQQKQQRLMGNMMVFVFAFMFYNFPAGLNIYWLSSMSLGILQQWIINKQMDKHQLLLAEGGACS